MKTFKIISVILVITMFTFTLTGCISVNELTQTDYSMGAVVTQTVTAIHESNSTQAMQKVIEEINKLDNLISYRSKDSDIYKLNTQGFCEVDALVRRMFVISKGLWENTDGMFDITILPLVRLWGFDGDKPALPDKADIESTLKAVGLEHLNDDEGVFLLNDGSGVDLSAMGKGAACDVAVGIYKKYGIKSAVISVGGSVGVFGTKNGEPFLIGVRDPNDTSKIIGTLALSNKFVSTSGSYEKFFTDGDKLYHHIINPKTGYPTESGLISVSVICESGVASDALSSACFALGYADSLAVLKAYGAEAVFVTADGSIIITDGLKSVWKAE
ncbi:FAD:protein FMN transferase [Eubacteriales bacterium OttesenSCG-928-G02]|nr:FAD:protein FMN transferase [Eubacteriales bacterium OttesenSCG-928-G02]